VYECFEIPLFKSACQQFALPLPMDKPHRLIYGSMY